MTTEVKPGQIWADNDWRSEGRTLRVDSIEPYRLVGRDTTVALCTVLTNAHESTRQTVGNRVRIRTDRMRPTSTGYRLVTDAPTEG